MSFEELQSRPGRFGLAQKSISYDFDLIKPLMSQVFIVKCEFDYHSQAFEYIGYSELFEVNLDGEIPPEYVIEMNIEEHSAEFVRIAAE